MGEGIFFFETIRYFTFMMYHPSENRHNLCLGFYNKARKSHWFLYCVTIYFCKSDVGTYMDVFGSTPRGDTIF